MKRVGEEESLADKDFGNHRLPGAAFGRTKKPFQTQKILRRYGKAVP